MKVLVTGATGFLGSHVARLLVERGERVRVLVRQVREGGHVDGLPVERVAGDLRDAASLDRAVARRGYRVSRRGGLPACGRAIRGRFTNRMSTGTRNLLAGRA